MAGALFFFGHGAAIHHHVFVGHVELDDAAADLLADQLFHGGGVALSAARGGHERAHSHVHAEAALDHGGYRAQDRGLLGKSLLQCRPVFRQLHLQARKFVITLRVAALDRDRKLIADLYRFSRALERRERQNAFGFVADIEKHRLG